VIETLKTYTLLAGNCNDPLHLAATEAGIFDLGVLKSMIEIEALFDSNIWDTIRMSLTKDFVKEIKVALNILRTLELRKDLEIISCQA
jgi:(E)-4-hydroxy-3-methylbut-2-enyl-diphosphate synthase